VAVWPEEEFVQGELPPPVGLPQGDAAETVPEAADDRREESHPGDADDIETTRAPSPPESRDAAAGAPLPHPTDADAIESAHDAEPPASRDSLPAGDEAHPSDADAIAAVPEGEATEAFWEGGDDAADAGVAADEPPAPPVRLTVYRAGYRWTLKGVDRGKWEVDVRAEADAPLEAIGDVVRGVHRRAGGEAEPERLSGDAVRAALSDRPWAATT
jgi:hypothetical protein